MEDLKQIIARTAQSERPAVHFIKQAAFMSERPCVFASSFNPITNAHLELMRRAATQFSLDATVALAAVGNADKRGYECSLADRLMMVQLALGAEEQTAIALSSHAFFVDMIDALAAHYGQASALHFTLGFDTFVRLLDADDRYTSHYHRAFNDRTEALAYLLTHCRLIVAGRGGTGHRDIQSLRVQLPEG